VAAKLWPSNKTRSRSTPGCWRSLQGSGHVISISSSAGLTGFEFGAAYAASKFGVEGWMESLRPAVAPFGIHTTIVNPGHSARSAAD
jgi:NAD(P)-dependent dehydrogenase (short-subunit alcohol dehydrogenase family)